MKYFITLALTLFSIYSYAQDKYKIVAVGFYNQENLFDYEQDTSIFDFDFIPNGRRAWTPEKYQEKLSNMAYAISKVGTEKAPAGLSFFGVAEVENRRVLEDLVKQEAIADRDYQIIHFDSPDRRGIDVGFLYNPTHFTPTETKKIPYPQYTEDTIYTRDVLFVKGVLDGDTITTLVNHWPSRYGGEKRSQPRRNAIAEVVRSVADSLYAVNPDSKILIMGDLNDDPTSESMTKYLKPKNDIKDVKSGDLYNPMHKYYTKGLGSNAYRDGWSLFDQIILSAPFLEKKQDGYFLYRANIFNKKFLIQRSGKYKGYPFRTFSFDKFQGGYSDHFPVYAYLIKKIK